MNGLMRCLLAAGLFVTVVGNDVAGGTAARVRQSPALRSGQVSQAVPTPATGSTEQCGCEGPSLPDVVARVNGTAITGKEVADAIEGQVAELRRQAIDARNQGLTALINARLLEAEARKRGISSTRLVLQETANTGGTPSDEELRAYYDKNRSRISGEFKDVRQFLIDSLRNQREADETGKLLARLRATAQMEMKAQKVTPPAGAAGRARVLATVNGQAITSGDLEDSLRSFMFGIQEQVYGLRKAEAERRINGVLLVEEARRRSVTPQALIVQEITAKTRAVTEKDAQAFYEQNKGRMQGTYSQLKEQILQYLQQQEHQRVEQAYAQSLRRSASIEMLLIAPEPPVYTITTDGQPFKGKADAPVTIVEFTDFQCPSCAQTHPILDRLAQEFGGQLKVVIRDFPLRMHANSFKAAEAAEAARAQERYWEYIFILYSEQSALAPENLKEYASQLGLDRARFDAELDSGKYAPQVERDLEEGAKLGVNATPTVFVQGRRMEDRSYESLKAAVQAALRRARKAAAPANKPTADKRR